MAQLMPLPLTISCFSKIQIGFTFLVPADPGSPGKWAVKRVCVCVCVSLSTCRHVSFLGCVCLSLSVMKLTQCASGICMVHVCLRHEDGLLHSVLCLIYYICLSHNNSQSFS